MRNGQTVFKLLISGVHLITFRCSYISMKVTGALDRFGCLNVGQIYRVIQTLSELSGEPSIAKAGAVCVKTET